MFPDDLLRSAQKSSGQGVTETVRAGAAAGVAAGETYRQLARLRGAVKFSLDIRRLREDRAVIAADTSSMVAFLQGDAGDDVELVQAALDERQLVLPPVVLSELLSEPSLTPKVRGLLTALPQLQIEPGYWERGRPAARRDHQSAAEGARSPTR
jgi:hypothetical protein